MKIKSFIFVALVAIAPVALAQTQRSGSDGAARAMQQLQQVAAEKDRLAQDNAAMKKELEEAKAKLSGLQAEQGKWQQRAKELEQSATRQVATSRGDTDALEKTRAQMQELIVRFRETAQNLKEVETDRDTLRSEAGTRERTLATCVDKNAQLYLLGTEVLSKYDQIGFWSTLRTKDAFTRMSKTRLENLADDYRQRIDELRIKSSTKSSVSSGEGNRPQDARAAR